MLLEIFLTLCVNVILFATDSISPSQLVQRILIDPVAIGFPAGIFQVCLAIMGQCCLLGKISVPSVEVILSTSSFHRCHGVQFCNRHDQIQPTKHCIPEQHRINAYMYR